MPAYLSDADLTYAEIHAEHYPERISPETVRALVEEVCAWRDLGDTPESVYLKIENLEWELENALDEEE